MRFVSDPLQFTGIDMGDGNGGRSRNSFVFPQEDGEDDDGTSEGYDSEHDVEVRRGHGAALSEREEAVVESALERIRRAQAKGKKDVRLTQEELAALERRRERIRAEEEARRKRKEKEQRFAVPLSHLEPTVRKRRSMVADEPTTQRAVSGSFREEPGRAVYPPMGYFPPPLASARSRPRSGTASSQRPPSRDPAAERSRGNSPFRYSYVQHGYPPSASRHVSDSAPRPPSTSSRQDARPSSYGQAPPASISAPSIPAQRQPSADPFRYIAADSRAPAGRRNVSGPPTSTSHQVYGQGTVPQDSLRRRSAEDTSEETASDDSDSTSEEYEATRVPSSGSAGGAPVVSRRGRSRSDVIVIEDSPEPEPEARREREPSTPRSKKSAGGSSPVKRKPVAGGGSSRRRKGR